MSPDKDALASQSDVDRESLVSHGKAIAELRVRITQLETHYGKLLSLAENAAKTAHWCRRKFAQIFPVKK